MIGSSPCCTGGPTCTMTAPTRPTCRDRLPSLGCFRHMEFILFMFAPKHAVSVERISARGHRTIRHSRSPSLLHRERAFSIPTRPREQPFAAATTLALLHRPITRPLSCAITLRQTRRSSLRDTSHTRYRTSSPASSSHHIRSTADSDL